MKDYICLVKSEGDEQPWVYRVMADNVEHARDQALALPPVELVIGIYEKVG